MKYYVAFDGGGSKVEAILFDENLKRIRNARMTGMNTASTSRETVSANARKLMDELIKREKAAQGSNTTRKYFA